MEEFDDNNYLGHSKSDFLRINSNLANSLTQSLISLDFGKQNDKNIRKSRKSKLCGYLQKNNTLQQEEEIQEKMNRFSFDIDRRNFKQIKLKEDMNQNLKTKKKMNEKEAEEFFRDHILKKKIKEKELQGKRNLAKRKEVLQRFLTQGSSISISRIKTENFLKRQKQFLLSKNERLNKKALENSLKVDFKETNENSERSKSKINDLNSSLRSNNYSSLQNVNRNIKRKIPKQESKKSNQNVKKIKIFLKMKNQNQASIKSLPNIKFNNANFNLKYNNSVNPLNKSKNLTKNFFNVKKEREIKFIQEDFFGSDYNFPFYSDDQLINSDLKDPSGELIKNDNIKQISFKIEENSLKSRFYSSINFSNSFNYTK